MGIDLVLLRKIFGQPFFRMSPIKALIGSGLDISQRFELVRESVEDHGTRS